MAAQRILTLAGLLVGLAALFLELGVQLSARIGSGGSLFGAVVRYFSFFTILGNLALVLVYIAALHRSSSLRWFRSPVTRGMTAAIITLVMLVYYLILAQTENARGLAKVSAVLAHYVTPILYLLWWALFARHGVLKLRDVPVMLVPSTMYMAYVMVRGRMVGEYPYAMLEANRLGSAAVALNAFYMLIALALLCAAVIGLDRLLVRVKLLRGPNDVAPPP